MLNVFVSGLERQTGKTFIAAGAAAAMQSLSFNTCVYKPIQTGAISLNGLKSSADVAYIKRIDPNIEVAATYMLSSYESPFVGAYEDNLKIDIGIICAEYKELSKSMDCGIVEGTNSISSPILPDITELDLVKALSVPVVIVINPKVTSINFAISALKYVKSEQVNLKGVILNRHEKNSDNLEEKYFAQIIKEFCDVQILGSVPDYGDLSGCSPEVIISNIINNIDLENMFGLKIAKLHRFV